jgi:hypothetical protein
MPQVLDRKPTSRFEPAGDERAKQLNKAKHHAVGCADSVSACHCGAAFPGANRMQANTQIFLSLRIKGQFSNLVSH